MLSTLAIHCGASTFTTPLDGVREWRAVLDCADAISLWAGSAERVRVRLGGLRRWIAFERTIGSSPYACIGYQETVGAVQRGHAYTGGSNRKVLAWINGDGTVSIGELPSIAREWGQGIMWITQDGKLLTGNDIPKEL
jgi:hypothetical protein